MTDQLQVPVFRVVDMPFPEERTVVRTYVPKPDPTPEAAQAALDDEPETKVVVRGRRPSPKATQGAETK